MTNITFQPFTDRLSRDIRNTLSKSLLQVISLQSLEPAQTAAESYLCPQLPAAYAAYIAERLNKYQLVLTTLGSKIDDPYLVACILWDKQLFFEVHEVLEPVWLKAEGEEKLFLQAMIRAAAVYMKLEYGYTEPASRIARKALPVFERNRERLARYTNPDELISRLHQLHLPPPLLLGEKSGLAAKS